MSAAIDRAIARLSSIFGEPRTADPELFVEEFRKALKGYDSHLIEKAVDRWMQRDTPFWPRPGELISVMESVASDLYRRPAEHNPISREEPDTESKARVRAMVQAAIARMKSDDKVVGEASTVQWERGQRAAFESMQKNSPRLHARDRT